MQLIANLFSGRVALWRTFWLIGLPLLIVWEMSVGCLFTECTTFLPINTPSPDLYIALLIMLTSASILFVAVAIWRSAMNHKRDTWWQSFSAASAKVYAIITGFSASLILFSVLYGLLHDSFGFVE
jgi:hypothetical protein